MNTRTRRTLICVGAALLLGGWALTGYADEQQQTVPVGTRRAHLWVGSSGPVASRTFYMTGVVSMALGAGLIGFGAIRTNKEAE